MGAIWGGPTRNPIEPARSKRMWALFQKYVFFDRFYSILGSKMANKCSHDGKKTLRQGAQKHINKITLNYCQHNSKTGRVFLIFSDPGPAFFGVFCSFVPQAPPCRQSAHKCQKSRQNCDFSWIFRQIRQPLEKNSEAFLWHRLSRNSTEKA